MKKRLVIAGAIIAATIFTAAIFADDIQKIAANVVQYKIIVNGDEKNFANSIVVINDRTYIPLREAGETLGLDVKWVRKNQVIIISNSQSQNNEEPMLIPFAVNADTLNELWGYKDTFGTVVIEPQFVNAREFKEGLAVVRTGQGKGPYGFINAKGDFVIPSQYMEANDFSDGIALIVTGDVDNYRNYYIDTSGKMLFDGKEFLMATDFKEGYAVVLTKGSPSFDIHDEDLKVRRFSYINKQGEYATELEFEQAMLFRNGLAFVKNNGKWGMINAKFELVVDYLYDDSELQRDKLGRIVGLRDD